MSRFLGTIQVFTSNSRISETFHISLVTLHVLDDTQKCYVDVLDTELQKRRKIRKEKKKIEDLDNQLFLKRRYNKWCYKNEGQT